MAGRPGKPGIPIRSRDSAGHETRPRPAPGRAGSLPNILWGGGLPREPIADRTRPILMATLSAISADVRFDRVGKTMGFTQSATNAVSQYLGGGINSMDSLEHRRETRFADPKPTAIHEHRARIGVEAPGFRRNRLDFQGGAGPVGNPEKWRIPCPLGSLTASCCISTTPAVSVLSILQKRVALK